MRQQEGKIHERYARCRGDYDDNSAEPAKPLILPHCNTLESYGENCDDDL